MSLSSIFRILISLSITFVLLASPLGTQFLSAEGSYNKIRVGGPCDHSGQIPFDQINHSKFNAILKEYVDERGQVCYSELNSNDCDRKLLREYIHQLGHVDASSTSSREAKLAYYINAYNALAIWGILHAYPVASVQKLNASDAEYQFFDDSQLWVGDHYLSLNQIENDILRPMREPRIHFALVCAAKGCPRLLNEAYTARKINLQLTRNAIQFFSTHQRFHIAKLTETVWLSPILKWYGEDFGNNHYKIVSAIFNYLPKEDRYWLANHPGWKLKYLGYNWGLNDRCPVPKVAFGRVPYAAYSHVSPWVEHFMPKQEQTSSKPQPNTQQSHPQVRIPAVNDNPPAPFLQLPAPVPSHSTFPNSEVIEVPVLPPSP